MPFPSQVCKCQSWKFESITYLSKLVFFPPNTIHFQSNSMILSLSRRSSVLHWNIISSSFQYSLLFELILLFFPVMIARCWRIVSLSTDGSQPMNNLWVEGDFLVPVLKTKNAFTRISLWLLFQGISVIFPPSFTVFWPDVCDITQISKEIWPSFFLQS